jgi:hypothetical protein
MLSRDFVFSVKLMLNDPIGVPPGLTFGAVCVVASLVPLQSASTPKTKPWETLHRK